MKSRRLEILLYVALGGMLGFGIAAFRNVAPLQELFAREPAPVTAQNDGEGKAVFFPPGTSDTTKVTPNPTNAPFKGKIGPTIEESEPYWPPIARAPKGAPNVLYIVLDDVGFGHLGCYGGGISTPNLDKLAKNGLRYNNFHTTALCSPSRSCFLTGRNHHSNAMAGITEISLGYPGYFGRIPLANAFLSEMLTPFGWAAFAIGKWHLTPDEDANLAANRKWWPLGRGFDRFYGFLGGEVDQFAPALTYDNHFVPPPKTAKEGYHLTPDLVSKAKEFILDLKHAAPDRPFFMYFCTGACHAPHQVPHEWVEKYKGKFDKGWDNYRQETLQRQIKLGVVPPGTKLSPHDPDVQLWNKLPEKEKKLYARMMEVYAGFLSHTDHYIGELIQFLETTGQLDNTLIMVVSDNGASAEGGPTGSVNENIFFNLVPESLERNLKAYNVLGSEATYNHYPWGWAWAGNTPFRRWKRETARGGVSDPLIVHWPKGIKAKGDIRHQFVHAIDLVPTVLDVIGIEPPQQINGVTQSPIEGVSFKATFDNPDAKLNREPQYFEMFAQRALDYEGWRVYSPWQFNKKLTRKDLGKSKWMLFNIDKDFSESEDLAAKFPSKLEEMKLRWWAQASKYDVLPLDGRGNVRLAEPRPQMSAPRDKYVYYPGGGEVTTAVAVDVRNKSYSITAEVEIPKDGAEGVLLAHGSNFGGYSFYVKDKKLCYVHNYVGIKEYKIASEIPVPAGKATLRFEFETTGPAQIDKGKGAPGIGRLFINGKKVGEGTIPVTVPIRYSLFGDDLCCGYDGGTPVSSDYESDFRFTGTIRRVIVDISGKK